MSPWGHDDATSLATIAADPLIQQFTSMPPIASDDDAAGWIAARTSDAAAGTALYLAIRVPEPVGSIHVVHYSEAHLSAELGYWLAPAARGKGLATQALVAFSRWCLTEFEWNRLELFVGPGNAVSERVAERAGYLREGVLRRYRRYRGVTLDLACYSVIPDDLDRPPWQEQP